MLRISDDRPLLAVNSRFSIAFFLLLLSCPLRAQDCYPWTMDDTYNLACEQCYVKAFADVWVCGHFECAPEIPKPNASCDACIRRATDNQNACVAALPPPPPDSPPPPTSRNQPYVTCGEGGPGPCTVTFLDPVPELQDGNNITTSPRILGQLGTSVGAVAADSAARVVLRIQTHQQGEQFRVTLLDEDRNPGTKEQLGTLSRIGVSEDSLQVTVTTVGDTGGDPMAFAVYRPPADFSRGGPSGDDNAARRTVSFRVEAVDDDSYNVTGSLDLLRPPLVLVHGLWGEPASWNNFTPLISDPLRRFFVRRAGYDYPVKIAFATPPFKTNFFTKWSALGFSFNAPAVLVQIKEFILQFRQSNQAAAAQADVIGHSMGGVVARTLQQLPDFTGSESFGKGYVHKLITIGTPHLGSPLAIELLKDENACFRTQLAKRQSVSIERANLGEWWENGAVGDLRGTGHGGSLSPALQNIKEGNNKVPTATIAGLATSVNLNSLDGLGTNAWFLRRRCSGDPLADNLTSTGWPNVLWGNSDGMVPVYSQSNCPCQPDGPSPGRSPIFPVVHSASLYQSLSFTGPGELDPQTAGPGPAGIQSQLIILLNEPAQGPDFR